MRIWWQRQERLERELQALASSGYRYEVLEGEPGRPEEMHVRVDYPMDSGEMRLDVYFPELYPYFRFQIHAPGLELDHHQNPFQGNLCLIGRSTENWSVGDTLAEYLNDQLPRVIRAGESRDREEVEEVEERQAEPFSEYYPYEPNSICLIDGEWEIPEGVASGELILGVVEPASPPLQLAVLEVRDEEGTTLAQADERYERFFNGRRSARWLRLEEPIKEGNPQRFFQVAAGMDGRVETQRWQNIKGGNIKMVATLFPEEHDWRAATGTGWVFAICARMRIGDQRGQRHYAFVRAGRSGPGDFAERVPELRFLRERKIAVFGLGCLGAVSVMEFAKAGVGELAIVDPDYVDPPTTVRWPLGLRTSGLQKALAIHQFIGTNFPYTKTTPFNYRVGEVRRQFGRREHEFLDRIAEGTSLVFDVTTEPGVHYFLSDLARSLDIPYVSVWGTQGGWGGFITHIAPGNGNACWGCVELARQQGEISAPPENAAGVIQPSGCGDPTFTGASFDMGMIALAGVRVAIASLRTGEGHYPGIDWNVEVISFRNESGRLIAPRWEHFTVPRNPDCRVCGSR